MADSAEESATRLRLTLGYDGTDFSGWAAQRDLRTVQGELQRVLGHLSSQDVQITCAGRTDAGVHARGQVAHVDVADASSLSVSRINRALPSDIRVVDVVEVDSTFDARFSALWRRYSYTVCDDPRGPSPMQRRYQLDITRELDIDAMNSAAEPLVGEHDFTSFCKIKEHGTTIREVLELHWERRIEETTGMHVAVMHIRADAFCHSMVRSVVGALIPVGEHRKPVDYPERALAMAAREAGVTVMAPHPLVLEEVGYPSAAQWGERQRETRTVRSAGR